MPVPEVKRHDVFWRVGHIIHNCVAHPLLPLAEYLDDEGYHRAADVLFKFHDNTAPKDDAARERYL